MTLQASAETYLFLMTRHATITKITIIKKVADTVMITSKVELSAFLLSVTAISVVELEVVMCVDIVVVMTYIGGATCMVESALVSSCE